MDNVDKRLDFLLKISNLHKINHKNKTVLIVIRKLLKY